MDANISTEDLFSSAKEDFKELETTRKEAKKAKVKAVDKAAEFERELRQRLMGKTIVVTGYTYAVDMNDQDGWGLVQHQERLDNKRVVVTGVFMSERRGSGDAPLVFATHEEAEGRLGGRISFWLLELSKFEISE